MEPQYVVALIITGLAVVAWALIMNWSKGWEDRLTAQDSRLDKHDDEHLQHHVNHVAVRTELENIKDTVSETHDDVKELLKQNGNRATG